MSGGDRFSGQAGIGPSYGLDGSSGLEPIRSIPFFPVDGEGQVIAIGAVSVRSLQLTGNKAHWLWSTKICHISAGNNAVVAVQGTSFPFPAGAVAEIIPSSVSGYIAVIEAVESAGTTGNLYIGQSEA